MILDCLFGHLIWSDVMIFSAILTSHDIESCITFLLSFEYLLAAISTSVSGRIRSVIMLYIGYNALYWIMCAVVGAYINW